MESKTIWHEQVSQNELQPIRFQGQHFDNETGLHYNRFRYCDPDLGMFTSRDPIELNGGMNVFAYTPNPINWVDPLGLNPAAAGRAGWAIGGVANVALEAAGISLGIILYNVVHPEEKVKAKSDDKPCTSGNCCPPFKPYPKGTIGYQGPETHKTGIDAGKAHYHIFVVNQNPRTCQCFWNYGKKSEWGHQYFDVIKSTWINLNRSSKRPPNYPH